MVRLLFFAGLRESLGVGELELELPKGIDRLSGLTGWLQERGAPWQEALSDTRLHVALNQEITHGDAPVRDGDEVAWYPPVTGG